MQKLVLTMVSAIIYGSMHTIYILIWCVQRKARRNKSFITVNTFEDINVDNTVFDDISFDTFTWVKHGFLNEAFVVDDSSINTGNIGNCTQQDLVLEYCSKPLHPLNDVYRSQKYRGNKT